MNEQILLSLKRHWRSLVKKGQELTYQKGQVLFYEGHSPAGLLVLQSGAIRFNRAGGNGGSSRVPPECGEEHLLTTPQGQVLGIKPFFDDTPYCCTCTAAQDCRILFIAKSQLEPLRKK